MLNEERRIMLNEEELCEDVYNFIFQLLDNEPCINGMEAGDIATKIEHSFCKLYRGTLHKENT